MDPWGSGGGSVGRAVTSNARGPRFESSHRQSFLLDIYLFTIKYIEKTKIKKKEAENGPFLKKIWIRNSRRKKFYGTSHKPYNAILIPYKVSI